MAVSLNDLLDEDAAVEQYYLSLPKDIQKSAAEHSEEIRTADDFHQFVMSVLK